MVTASFGGPPMLATTLAKGGVDNAAQASGKPVTISPALGHTMASSLVQRPSEAPSWGPLANCNLHVERLAGVFSDSEPLRRGCLVLERVGGVVPRLTTIDLETAAHLRIAVDADDLVALGALPPLETVGRALERHARAALVAHLALQGGGAGATCVAREVSAHVVVSLLLPVSAGPHHQHGPTHAILHPSVAKFRMPISYPLVTPLGLTGRVRSSACLGTSWLPCKPGPQPTRLRPAPTWCQVVPVARMHPWLG